MIDQLEAEMHELDRELNELRRELWMTEHGLTKPTQGTRDVEMARLRARFDELGARFTTVYRAWSEQHAED